MVERVVTGDKLLNKTIESSWINKIGGFLHRYQFLVCIKGIEGRFDRFEDRVVWYLGEAGRAQSRMENWSDYLNPKQNR